MLVDEYQDTNRLQAAILLGAEARRRGRHGGRRRRAVDLLVPGGRRCATSSTFPGCSRRRRAIVALEQNYRSTPPILEAANAVIAEASGAGSPSGCWSERPAGARPALVQRARRGGPGRFRLPSAILEAREAGTALREQAVLFRAAHQARALEVELVRRNIPFVKYGGLKFLDAAHVKDVMACLRWRRTRRDRVAGFRVLQLLPGVGPATAERGARRDGGGGRAGAGAADIAAAARRRDGLGGLRRLYGRCGRRRRLARELGAVRGWYDPQLERLYDGCADAPGRSRCSSRRSPRASEPGAVPDRDDARPAGGGRRSGRGAAQDEDYLILSTIHSAKGQEWRRVYVLNCVDGCIPVGPRHRDQRRDRRGAAAVLRGDDPGARPADAGAAAAVPRARAAPDGDKYVRAARTRFVPDAILDRFDCAAWPPPAATPGNAPRPRREMPLDLAARMRGMWS